jgi:hypothetical protein
MLSGLCDNSLGQWLSNICSLRRPTKRSSDILKMSFSETKPQFSLDPREEMELHKDPLFKRLSAAENNPGQFLNTLLGKSLPNAYSNLYACEYFVEKNKLCKSIEALPLQLVADHPVGKDKDISAYLKFLGLKSKLYRKLYKNVVAKVINRRFKDFGLARVLDEFVDLIVMLGNLISSFSISNTQIDAAFLAKIMEKRIALYQKTFSEAFVLFVFLVCNIDSIPETDQLRIFEVHIKKFYDFNDKLLVIMFSSKFNDENVQMIKYFHKNFLKDLVTSSRLYCQYTHRKKPLEQIKQLELLRIYLDKVSHQHISDLKFVFGELVALEERIQALKDKKPEATSERAASKRRKKFQKRSPFKNYSVNHEDAKSGLASEKDSSDDNSFTLDDLKSHLSTIREMSSKNESQSNATESLVQPRNSDQLDDKELGIEDFKRKKIPMRTSFYKMKINHKE